MNDSRRLPPPTIDDEMMNFGVMNYAEGGPVPRFAGGGGMGGLLPMLLGGMQGDEGDMSMMGPIGQLIGGGDPLANSPLMWALQGKDPAGPGSILGGMGGFAEGGPTGDPQWGVSEGSSPRGALSNPDQIKARNDILRLLAKRIVPGATDEYGNRPYDSGSDRIARDASRPNLPPVVTSQDAARAQQAQQGAGGVDSIFNLLPKSGGKSGTGSSIFGRIFNSIFSGKSGETPIGTDSGTWGDSVLEGDSIFADSGMGSIGAARGGRIPKFAGGGMFESGGFGNLFGSDLGGAGGFMPWLNIGMDAYKAGESYGLPEDYQEQHSGTYKYDPLSSLWQSFDNDKQTYGKTEKAGEATGHVIGDAIGMVFPMFAPFIREGAGRLGAGIGAWTSGQGFHKGFENLIEGTPLDAVFAEGGAVTDPAVALLQSMANQATEGIDTGILGDPVTGDKKMQDQINMALDRRPTAPPPLPLNMFNSFGSADGGTGGAGVGGDAGATGAGGPSGTSGVGSGTDAGGGPGADGGTYARGGALRGRYGHRGALSAGRNY